MTTNGLWNGTQRKFIFSNFSDLSFSFDGLPTVQHSQRPTTNGNDSFEVIKRNLIAIGSTDIGCRVRATIMPGSLNNMLELVDFLHAETNVCELRFEPLLSVGRAKGLQVEDRFESDFVARYIEAKQYAENFGIKVAYSGCSDINASGSYCGATGANINFTVMVDGTVSSCYEVNSASHELGEFFIFGNFDATSKFNFRQDRLERLTKFSTKHNSPCGSCFAQWNCRGDCLTRYSKDALLNGGSSSRCGMNKEIATKVIEGTARGRLTSF